LPIRERILMARKAFCVGLNDYPGDGNDLNGCVNDANDWANLLVEHFDFPRSEVRVITDSEATKQNMVGGIKDLLAGAGSGDVLVFTNSSHGSYVPDRSGDEPKYDEIICPYDIMQSVLTDDELRELFADLPDGVNLTVISDSCFSGTVTRAAPFRPVPDDRRVRFLNPRIRGDEELTPTELNTARSKRPEKYPESGMKEILLSGASDRQYATDAIIDNSYHGAMTYFAIQAIRQANYQITYQELIERLRDLIAADYSQDPQLEGKDENKQKQIFS
jgi:hypothetical protein